MIAWEKDVIIMFHERVDKGNKTRHVSKSSLKKGEIEMGSMLDFLVSFLVATESYEKVKTAKRETQTRNELRESSRIHQMYIQELRSNYEDINLELDMKYELKKTKKKNQDQSIFFLSDVIKKMPSYDKSRDKELYDGLRNTPYDTEQIIKRLYLAEYGKLPHLEISGIMSEKLESQRGIWYGRERYDYMGQIKHELMLEWESRLHEKGFPYDLYSFNKLDYPELPMSERPSRVCISQWKLAKETNYRFGNEYFFNFPTNLQHVANCKLCRRCKLWNTNL